MIDNNLKPFSTWLKKELNSLISSSWKKPEPGLDFLWGWRSEKIMLWRGHWKDKEEKVNAKSDNQGDNINSSPNNNAENVETTIALTKCMYKIQISM